MGLKYELGKVNYEIRQLEERRMQIFRESKDAPEEDKVCLDSHVAMIDELKVEPTVYPLTISDIAYDEETSVVEHPKNTGAFVSIRPCAPEYEGKTYLGLYLGDISISTHLDYNKETSVLHVSPGRHNPAIYVFNLKKIVFGMESWWGTIKSEANLEQITDKDIENIWYVKALKELRGK
jgi:hypothetical protein